MSVAAKCINCGQWIYKTATGYWYHEEGGFYYCRSETVATPPKTTEVESAPQHDPDISSGVNCARHAQSSEFAGTPEKERGK